MRTITPSLYQRVVNRNRRYRICIVHPDGGGHKGVFEELAELICASLRELGFKAQWGYNEIELGATNIIIGIHLLGHEWRDHLPSNTILINTEQIGAVRPEWQQQIMSWLEFGFHGVDYSQANITAFAEAGIHNVKHLKIGYQKELTRLKPVSQPTIDVLFYGTLNERREHVIEEMRSAGLKIKHLYDVYGAERDQWMEKTRIILNMHYFPTQVFESIRVFYPISNGIPVLSEVNPDQIEKNVLTEAVCGVPYEKLATKAIELCRSPDALEQLSISAFKTIQSAPQHRYTAEAFNVN